MEEFDIPSPPSPVSWLKLMTACAVSSLLSACLVAGFVYAVLIPAQGESAAQSWKYQLEAAKEIRKQTGGQTAAPAP